MTKMDKCVSLVRAAQKGNRTALNQLAIESQGKVCAFIHRVTLNEDLAQDLSQETLLTMMKSIQQCQKPESYWPWIYQVARSKILQHYRTNSRQTKLRNTATEQAVAQQFSTDHSDTAYRKVAQQELTAKMFSALKTLGQDHRLVLSLRCLEQLSYAEIAQTMKCSEVKVRVIFHRAKLALRRRLVHDGLDARVLGAGLLVFGKTTAPDAASAASFTMPAQLFETSWGISLCAAICSTGFLACLVTLLAISSTIVVAKRQFDPPHRSEVKSVHFTMQSRNPILRGGSENSRGAYEQWYYFPDGPEGPLLARMQRWTPDLKKAQCEWLLSKDEHFYYNSGQSMAYLRNRTWWWGNGDVRRLPTDPPELTAFLDEHTADFRGVQVKNHPRAQMPQVTFDNRFPRLGTFKNQYQYNDLDSEFFTYPWADDVPIKDIRDSMHKQGWTYFEFEGQIAGQMVKGQGQIPFHYTPYCQTPPWLHVDVNGEPYLLDTSQGAVLLPEKTLWPKESFFLGLARPWSGLHSFDTLRRDAALNGLLFKSEASQKTMRGKVEVLQEIHERTLKLIYHIDMDNDLIMTIDVTYHDRPCGHLTFSYPQGVNNPNEIGMWSQPTLPKENTLTVVKEKMKTKHWLSELVRQNF